MSSLQGKKLLITGVINRESIAYEVAKQAQAAGAEIVLTSFGRAKRMTERSAAEARPGPGRARARRQQARGHRGASRPTCASAGAASTASCTRSPSRPRTRSAATSSTRRWRARSPRSRRRRSRSRRWPSASPTCIPEEGAAIVGLDFDAQVAWPVYDWMGVAKAALEATSRYLARDLGPRRVRVNLVSRRSAGDARRARHPGLQRPRRRAWEKQAPLPWDVEDPAPVAETINFLLSRRRARRSRPRSSTSTAASTRWARRSCRVREEVEA